MPIRNPYACHPLLRKGGPHVKSRSGQRRQVKDELMDEAQEYMLDRPRRKNSAAMLKQDLKQEVKKDQQQVLQETEHDITQADLNVTAEGGDTPPFLCLLRKRLYVIEK